MANTGGRSFASRAGSVARRVVGRGASQAGTAAAAPAKKAATTKAATKKAAAKKSPAAKAPAKRAPAKQTAAKKTALKKPAPQKTAAKKTAAKKTAPQKTAAKQAPAKQAAAKKQAAATPQKKVSVKKTESATSAQAQVPAVAAKPETGVRKNGSTRNAEARLVVSKGEKSWTKKELNEVRTRLRADIKRLASELEVAEEDLHGLMLDAGDGAGNDQADIGSSTFERDQEMFIANNERDMLEQSQHALERIADGSYGVCESNGEPIGKMRLMAFPRATLCLPCKQREERR